MWNRDNYTLYNSKKDVDALNLNTNNRERATIFPYGLYSGDILPVDDYICGQENNQICIIILLKQCVQ